MRTLKQKIMAAAILLAATGVSQAAVVTFDTVVGPPNNGLYFGSHYGSYTVEGFTWDTAPFSHGHLVTDITECYLGCTDNGTQYLGGNMTNLIMKAVGGGTFSVSSFDASAAYLDFPQNHPAKIILTGTLQGGGTISETVTLAPAGFSTIHINGFNNLTKLTFWGANAAGGTLVGTDDGYYIGIDNINTSPVPEPATYGMLLAGLGLMGMMRRWRKG
jgi:hypothetical protein